MCFQKDSACADLAVIQQFLALEVATVEKRALAEVVRMLVGLRKSWEKNAAYLDLCVSKAELEPQQPEPGIDLLSRIVLILRALSGGC